MNVEQSGRVTIINVFTPKPGQTEAFVAAQTEGMKSLRDKIPGWRGTRMYRALDDRTATLVSTFASLEDYRAWMASDLFARHRDKIAPLIERAGPQLYRLVYEAGEP